MNVPKIAFVWSVYESKRNILKGPKLLFKRRRAVNESNVHINPICPRPGLEKVEPGESWLPHKHRFFLISIFTLVVYMLFQVSTAVRVS